MRSNITNNKNSIEKYLLKYSHINYYHLGDLDDFFWPHTTWYANQDKEGINAICLFYSGLEPPVLLGILNDNLNEMETLIKDIIPLLPDSFYAHFSPGLENLFESQYNLEHHGEHLKMFLEKTIIPYQFEENEVEQLSVINLKEVQDFYIDAYPKNWFDPRMLETNQYIGMRNEMGELACVGGVHVYSEKYNIAVIGNIATLPEYRKHGFGTKLVNRLCVRLLTKVKGVGLNVRSDNLSAIGIYERIGFKTHAIYHEWMLRKKS